MGHLPSGSSSHSCPVSSLGTHVCNRTIRVAFRRSPPPPRMQPPRTGVFVAFIQPCVTTVPGTKQMSRQGCSEARILCGFTVLSACFSRSCLRPTKLGISISRKFWKILPRYLFERQPLRRPGGLCVRLPPSHIPPRPCSRAERQITHRCLHARAWAFLASGPARPSWNLKFN